MKKLALYFLFICLGKLSAQTYSPVNVTGFNLDAVAETFPNSLATTTQALDQVVAGGNSVMYSVGFATSAGWTGGLPNSGTIINGSKTYQLMPYNGNNALFAPSGSTNNLTLGTPAQYSNISFLVFSTEGASTVSITLNYTDLTSTNAGNFSIQDWFNGTGAIISGIGRCKRVTSGATNDGVPTNPRFYSIDLSLSCANQQKNLASITIKGVTSNPAGGGAYIMAVSGASLSSLPPTIAYTSNAYCQAPGSITPTITGTGGGTFSSSPAGLSLTASTGAINLGSSSANTYTITYTTPGACSLTTSYSLMVNASPTITVNSPTICSGTSTVLTANGATSYSWNTGATTQTISVSPTSTTNYTVTGSDAGCSTNKTGSVTVIATPTISVNNPSICDGNSSVLSASGAASYTWSTGANSTSITVSPSVTTIYTVTGTTSGCSASNTSTLTVTPIPTVAVNNAIVCTGTSTILTATGAATYSWSTGATTSTISVSPSSNSVYTVTGTTNGCSSSNTSTVSISPAPTLTVNSATICSGESVNLISTPSISGGSFSWSPGAQTSSSISVSPSISSAYTVVYSVNGCSVSAVSNVSVNPTPNITVNSVTVCDGQGGTLTANPSINGGTYLWSPLGETTQSITDTVLTTTPYTVLYSLNGCTTTATGTITVNPNPVLVLSPSVNTSIPFEDITITASGGGTYVWSNGGTGSHISVNPQNTTTYCATVTATSGCTNTACIEIQITDESSVYIPNVFTPNGDGVNDIFYTPGHNLTSYSISIFNRWGEELFTSDDPTKGWDGSFKGQIVPNGTYVYVLKAAGADNVIYNKSGHITILE